MANRAIVSARSRLTSFNGTSTVARLAVAPGGRLVAATAEGDVLVYDLETRQVLHTLSGTRGSTEVAVNGRREGRDGDRPGSFRDHLRRRERGADRRPDDHPRYGERLPVAIRPDGKELAIGGGVGQDFLVWDLDPQHWVTAACTLAGRNLTQEEWDTYIGDLAEYHTHLPRVRVKSTKCHCCSVQSSSRPSPLRSTTRSCSCCRLRRRRNRPGGHDHDGIESNGPRRCRQCLYGADDDSRRSGPAVWPREVELVDDGYGWSEGPQWMSDAGVLLFTDANADAIYQVAADDEVTMFRQPSGYANGLAVDGQGRLLAAEQRSRSVTRTESDGTVMLIAAEFEGVRLNRPNDIAVRSDGTIYFTDPLFADFEHELDFRGIFRIAPDGGVTAERRGRNHRGPQRNRVVARRNKALRLQLQCRPGMDLRRSVPTARCPRPARL